MNIDNWTKAFENLGAELVLMKLPMKQTLHLNGTVYTALSNILVLNFDFNF